tara:strand:- start:255 stop:689 length:435 start_codon:yes stop_codon:yes gene_type:complete
MSTQGDVVAGFMDYCDYCYGILASDRWMNANLRLTTLRNLRKAVFEGEPAGYRCPSCQGEMVKAPVSTNTGASVEVDGCLKCGSMWFDNREIEPFFPQIQDVLPGKEQNKTWGDRIVGLASYFTSGSEKNENLDSEMIVEDSEE